MQLLPRHFHLQSPVSGFSIPHFLGQYDIPKHEAINWKRVTENANNMGMQRHKMIKMPVDTHLAGRSFRGSVCKCSHNKVIFLWNLVLLCPHTSPDPQLAVDMGLTRCRNSYGSSKVRDCMDQGMHGWISCWVKWVHPGKQNVFYLCPDYWLVPIEPITCCDVLNSTQKLTLPVLPIPEVDDSIPS